MRNKRPKNPQAIHWQNIPSKLPGLVENPVEEWMGKIADLYCIEWIGLETAVNFGKVCLHTDAVRGDPNTPRLAEWLKAKAKDKQFAAALAAFRKWLREQNAEFRRLTDDDADGEADDESPEEQQQMEWHLASLEAFLHSLSAKWSAVP